MDRRAAPILAVALAATLSGADGDESGFDIAELLLDQAMAGLQIAAVIGPREALGDSGRRETGFARWPWADGEAGYALPADGFPGGRRLVWRLSGELGDLDDPGEGRERVELLVEGSWRYGLSGSLDVLGDRRLWSADLLWRPAQGPLGMVRTGGGPRVLADGDDRWNGFGLVYDLELFPVRPVIIGLRGEFGWLDDEAVLRGRAQAGVSLWRIEAYGGWDGLAIGEVRANGPYAGMRVRW